MCIYNHSVCQDSYCEGEFGQYDEDELFPYTGQRTLSDESATVKGVHVISVCDARDKRAYNLECLIEGVRMKREALIKQGKTTFEQLHQLWLEYHWYLDQLHRRFLVRQIVVENITTTVGRSVIAQRLSGITTYTGVVNYGALGTSNTAAAVGNTQLGAEVYRKALSSGTYASNVAYLENFYTATETTGTYQEYGFFIDGTGSANTGQLFNRFTSTVVKSNTETLNVQSTITINNSQYMAGNLVSATVNAGDAANASQYNNIRKDILQNAGDCVASTGSSNAYAISIDSQISAYSNYQVFKFKANFTNTGTATLNVNTLGAKTIKKNNNQDLSPNDIQNGQIVVVVYDGTNMQLVSQAADQNTRSTNICTTGEAVDGSTTPQLVSIKLSDGKAYKAKANDTALTNAYGFVVSNAGNGTTPYVVTGGIVGGFTALTPGATYYASDTAGAITKTTSSTTVIPVGVALSASQLLVKFGRKIAYGTGSYAASTSDTVTYTLGFKPSRVEFRAYATGSYQDCRTVSMGESFSGGVHRNIYWGVSSASVYQNNVDTNYAFYLPIRRNAIGEPWDRISKLYVSTFNDDGFVVTRSSDGGEMQTTFYQFVAYE